MTAGTADYESIGPYRIVRRLGFGRRSEVLLATRLFPGNFERSVVIKRLLARHGDDLPERQAILAAEALAYARVAHPAIVQLFDFFSHEGHLALVLEYIDGVSLAKLLEELRLRRERVGDGVAFFVAARVFAALAAAHTARDPRTGEITPVIHRDVSPSNVLIAWDGFAKLGDFDLSKVLGVSGDTRAGLMKGTYGYMAPEQVTGDPVTPRTDVYAGCLVLRELLLGRPSFDENLPELELLQAMLHARLAPVETLRSGITRRLADAMGRGLARDPAERTVTAAEMVELLRSHADMELAHAELIAKLERVRADGGAPPSPSRSSFHTPHTLTFSTVAESLPPIEEGAVSARPAPRPDRSTTIVSALTAVGVLALAFALATTVRTSLSPPTATPTPTPTLTPTLTATLTPTPAATPTPTPFAPDSPFGALVPPSSARHHRLWIDGKLASWTTGPSIRVPCGPHVVRIGAGGASQSVDVPCGGRLSLDDIDAK